MHPYCGLSEAEYELMNLFWSQNKPLQLADIVQYCHTELDNNWATTTICTYLGHLVMKGFLKTDHKRYRKSYSALISKNELSQMYAKQVLQESFDGSLKNFLASFTQGVSLTPNEINELISILHTNMSSKDN